VRLWRPKTVDVVLGATAMACEPWAGDVNSA
jgi:hypothetical protein